MNNVTALQNWKSSFTADKLQAFLALPTEAERLAMLDSFYYDDLDKFEAIPLWQPGCTPEFDAGVSQREPSLRFFPCENAKGCVLISPGGAYSTIAIDPEGFPVARKFVESGYAAAVLDYRVRPYTGYVSLLDMQRAIRLLRHRAPELGFDPQKLVVHGGSAGGHLCTMACSHWDNGKDGDEIDRESSRPNAAIISYGTFSSIGFPHADRLCKFTPDCDRDLLPLSSPYSCDQDERRHRVFFSPEYHITPDTPPMFFWQTCDEDDPRQLFRLATALAENGVRFEAHVFPYGKHGGGLWDGSTAASTPDPHVANWFRLALEWLDLELSR